jgi:EAL domain-containing protein (putative c-di-GMP-specific phosphodiesterase class I)
VEGIENAEQAKLISELNVAFGQGFLFSKPLPQDEVFNAVIATLA